MLGLTAGSNVGTAGTFEFSVRSGGAGNDVVAGDDGADVIDGGDGDDWITGSGGNDVLLGDGGRDWINGGDGHDRVDGGDSNDKLNGGLGDDILFGGSANDIYIGGAGIDTFQVTTGTDWISDLALNDEQDIVHVSAGAKVIAFAAGNWVATAASAMFRARSAAPPSCWWNSIASGTESAPEGSRVPVQSNSVRNPFPRP